MDQFTIAFLIYTFGIATVAATIGFTVGRAAFQHETWDSAYRDVCEDTKEYDVIEGHAEEVAEFLEWIADEIDAGQLCNSDTVSFSRSTPAIAEECLMLADHLIKSRFGRHKPGFLTRIAQRAGTAPTAPYGVDFSGPSKEWK